MLVLGRDRAPGRAPLVPRGQIASDALEVGGGHAVGREPRRPVRDSHGQPVVHDAIPPATSVASMLCKRMHTLVEGSGQHRDKSAAAGPAAGCGPVREMMETDEFLLVVNGAEHTVRCEPDTPLLDVLRHDLGLAGPRFGCGLGLCGACFVLIDGRARSSCDLPVSAADGRGHDRRGAAVRRPAASGPAGLPRRAGRSVRLLHRGHGDERGGPAAAEPRPDRAGRPGGAGRQPVPLR